MATFDVEVIETRLEKWLPTGGPFALVFAATSWHWVDPAVRYRLAGEVLEPRGHLAIWGAGHVIPHDGDPFFVEIQEIYDQIGESMPPEVPLPRPQELDDDSAEIVASGLFEIIDITQFDWGVVYDADSYIDLLNTFSGHIAMQDSQRDRLYGEIRRRLAQRTDGQLRRHWGGVSARESLRAEHRGQGVGGVTGAAWVDGRGWLGHGVYADGGATRAARSAPVTDASSIWARWGRVTALVVNHSRLAASR